MNKGIGASLGIYKEIKKQDIVKAMLFHISEKHILKEMADRAKMLHISDLNKISSLILMEKFNG